MKKFTGIVLALLFAVNIAHAESISNDLLSSTVGFWGTTTATNGAPEATPTDYNDADYVVVPIGTGSFTWETSDGTDGEGVVTMWIYDAATSVENTDLGYPNKGPWWGIKSGSASGDFAVGIKRAVYVSYDQGYYVYSNLKPFGGAWYIDGLRGAHGVAFSAGWYKFGFLGNLDNVQVEVYNVDHFENNDKSLSVINGTASRIYTASNPNFTDVLAGDGWNGLSFKGDGASGVENINVAIAGGSGVFAGVGDGTAPVAPMNISSWGAVKALYR